MQRRNGETKSASVAIRLDHEILDTANMSLRLSLRIAEKVMQTIVRRTFFPFLLSFSSSLPFVLDKP